MARFKDTNWSIAAAADGGVQSIDGAHLAVLMDIRDELKRINDRLNCPETVAIPRRLATISRHCARIPKAKP
ncbi:MAG TPA: hypothetical protein VEY89_02445 [Candidatus Dormibacteraeota bacterium]|nr:hypothetical protein [Candidatus Dormibacteraeota bacterium]